MLWGRVTYEMMESYWPAVARGDVEAPPAMREWAVKLEVKPEVRAVVDAKGLAPVDQQPPRPAATCTRACRSSRTADTAGVLLGSGKLATELEKGWI